jgi:hypothetical protein
MDMSEQVHDPAVLPRGERTHSTHWVGDWVSPKPVWTPREGNNLFPLPEIEPRPSSPHPVAVPSYAHFFQRDV